MIVVFLPFYAILRKDRIQMAQYELEQSKMVLAVVTANTEVQAGLKVTLDMTRDTMEKLRVDNKDAFMMCI